jgi:hypothetical protein
MEFRKTMKLTKGDIRTGGGDLTATMWKDKRHVNMLTNVHHPPAEGSTLAIQNCPIGNFNSVT